jgi:hypothetical protein
MYFPGTFPENGYILVNINHCVIKTLRLAQIFANLQINHKKGVKLLKEVRLFALL